LFTFELFEQAEVNFLDIGNESAVKDG